MISNQEHIFSVPNIKFEGVGDGHGCPLGARGCALRRSSVPNPAIGVSRSENFLEKQDAEKLRGDADLSPRAARGNI